MIRTGKLIPEIYYRESRDFQLFGKTYDIIFNYIKTNVDLMENFPISNYTDSKLIDLLCRTLGFENKENYRNDDLNAICNVFMSLIKNKGTIKSIETLVKTILRVEGIKRKFDVAVLTDENQKHKYVQISIPDVITNPEIKLMEEVLEYIIPAGMCYNIRTATLLEVGQGKITFNQALSARNLQNNNEYSNISIAKDDSLMATSNESKSETDIGHFGDIENPRVGDIRYSKVIGKVGK